MKEDGEPSKISPKSDDAVSLRQAIAFLDFTEHFQTEIELGASDLDTLQKLYAAGQQTFWNARSVARYSLRVVDVFQQLTRGYISVPQLQSITEHVLRYKMLDERNAVLEKLCETNLEAYGKAIIEDGNFVQSIVRNAIAFLLARGWVKEDRHVQNLTFPLSGRKECTLKRWLVLTERGERNVARMKNRLQAKTSSRGTTKARSGDTPWMSVAEAAKYLGIEAGTLRNWISQKYVPFVRRGRVVRLNQHDLDKWLRHRACPGRRTRASG